MAAVQLTLDELQPQVDAISEPAAYLGSMGAMCWLTDCLCWEQYGYWSECGGPPAWASETLTKAKQAAHIAKPADVRYSVEVIQKGNIYEGTFRVWDEANPWSEPWSVNFTGYHSAEAARQEYAGRFADHKRWQEEEIAALIHWRETGEATIAASMPENQFYWRKLGFNPSKHVHLKENQPGVICYERLPAADPTDMPGMIHVEIEPHRVDDWCADCFAETPGPDRKQIGTYLHGKTYEEAAALGRQWIAEVGRPHVTVNP